jgi:hypothetical protein
MGTIHRAEWAEKQPQIPRRSHPSDEDLSLRTPAALARDDNSVIGRPFLRDWGSGGEVGERKPGIDAWNATFPLDAGSNRCSQIWALESCAKPPMAVFNDLAVRVRQGTAVETPCNCLEKATRAS